MQYRKKALARKRRQKQKNRAMKRKLAKLQARSAAAS
jgi:hypothetical protein